MLPMEVSHAEMRIRLILTVKGVQLWKTQEDDENGGDPYLESELTYYTCHKYTSRLHSDTNVKAHPLIVDLIASASLKR
jgi:hypothetical protein